MLRLDFLLNIQDLLYAKTAFFCKRKTIKSPGICSRYSVLDNAERILLFCFPTYRRRLNTSLFSQKREIFKVQGTCHESLNFMVLSSISNKTISKTKALQQG